MSEVPPRCKDGFLRGHHNWKRFKVDTLFHSVSGVNYQLNEVIVCRKCGVIYGLDTCLGGYSEIELTIDDFNQLMKTNEEQVKEKKSKEDIFERSRERVLNEVDLK